MFSFCAMGDWGYMTLIRKNIRTVIQNMMSNNFIIFLGDNFYPGGVQNTHDDQWSLYEYDYGNIPSYAVLGNHDYLKDPFAQMMYTSVSINWNMPFFFYDVIHDDCQIFFIDTMVLAPMMTKMLTEVMGQSFDYTGLFQNLKQQQMEWLEHKLENCVTKWKIVCGHYPVYSGGFHGDTMELFSSLLPIFERHKIDIYICGHDHSIQHIVRNNINYYVVGSGSETTECGEVPGTKYYNSIGGFVNITVDKNNLTSNFIDEHGNLLYQHILIK
jgi:acid phosphatase